jgi:hypothetical protein
VAVELGFTHPIELRSCGALFEGEGLYLFGGDGEVLHADPLPAFAPVSALVHANIALDGDAPVTEGGPVEQGIQLRVPLRLAPSQDLWRNVVATVISVEQAPWLARLLYAIPNKTLSRLRMAIGESAIYLLDEAGIEGVPIGTFFCRVTEGVYIPAGSILLPAVSPALVDELVASRGAGHVFFRWGDHPPALVAAEAFGPVTKQSIFALGAKGEVAVPPTLPEELLPLLRYDEAHRFPTWGIPGQELPGEGDT